VTTDLYVLGTGINSPLHLTLETRQAISRCRKLFVLHASTYLVETLRSGGSEVVDLASFYEGATLRRDVYRAIAEHLVAEAKKATPIGFVVHGHPMFLVSATELVLELAASGGVRARVLPGVSSFDTLLCDLGLDLGYGVQLFDTSTMLDQGWVPNPDVPLLLFQLATTKEPAVVRGHRTGGVLKPVMQLLIPLYGPSHTVTLVSSAAGLLDRSEVVAMPLDRLAHSDVDLTNRPTLYVPAR
jgi:siroheme synthase